MSLSKTAAAIVVALIAAIGTIVAAVISSSKAREASVLKDEVQELLARAPVPPPIGTVIGSMLTEAQLADSAGDPELFSRTKSKWSLADGRDVTGSAYESSTKRALLPDLRGVFLRGVNLSRSDGKGDTDLARPVGDYQPDAFRKHVHEVYGHAGIANPPQKGTAADGSTIASNETAVAGEADETRPRNVTVYYYVRIN